MPKRSSLAEFRYNLITGLIFNATGQLLYKVRLYIRLRDNKINVPIYIRYPNIFAFGYRDFPVIEVRLSKFHCIEKGGSVLRQLG